MPNSPDQSEKPNMPRTEAHPEPPLSKGPLLDELHRVAGKPMSRRKAIGTTLSTAAGAILAAREGINRLNNSSSAHEEESTPEIYTGPKVDLAGRDENMEYFFSDVAEYIDLEKFVYRDLYDKNGSSTGLEAPIIHEFDPDEKFDEAPKRSIDIETKLGEGVKLVRLAIDAESGARYRIMGDPENGKDDVPIWLGFARENPKDPKHPIWTDEHGNILDDGKVYVVSPIFTQTSDPKRK